jgi:hypothetical protein
MVSIDNNVSMIHDVDQHYLEFHCAHRHNRYYEPNRPSIEIP